MNSGLISIIAWLRHGEPDQVNQLRSYECSTHGNGENKGGFCYSCANEQEAERQKSELAEFRAATGNRSSLRKKLLASENRINQLARDLQRAGELHGIDLFKIENLRRDSRTCVGCEREPVVGARASAECLSCSRYHEDNYRVTQRT